MLPIYIGGLVFGGVLLGASLSGHGQHDHDHDAGGGDTGHDHDQGGQQFWLPFLSLRFWAFAVAFFGLAGVALTLTGGIGAVATPLVAGAVGLGCGLGSARVIGALSRRPVGLLGASSTHVGREGRLLLPVAPGRRGKLRLQIGGTSTDLVAETEGDAALTAGDTVLVVGFKGNVAVVERLARFDAALGPAERKDEG